MRSRDHRDEGLNKTMHEVVRPQFKPVLNDKRRDLRMTTMDGQKNGSPKKFKQSEKQSYQASTEKFVEHSHAHAQSPHNVSITTFVQEEVSPLKSTLPKAPTSSNLDMNINSSEQIVNEWGIVVNRMDSNQNSLPYPSPLQLQSVPKFKNGSSDSRQSATE